MNSDEFVLQHFGIKGMHWGVRKGRDSSRTRYKKAPLKLTDSELKRRIQRMESEKRYNDLNKRDVTAGEAFATNLLKTVGGGIAGTLLTGAGIYAGKKLLAKKLGEEAVDRMFPKAKISITKKKSG